MWDLQNLQKPPPRPVVLLPMASNFQKTVTIDLEHYKGRILLHLVDLCKCLSAASIISNKDKGTIIRETFKTCIVIYG